MNLYSIFDTKAELYLKPFQMQNDATAIRAITSSILQNEELTAYPSDYILKRLGSYHESTGVIIQSSHEPADIAPIASLVLAAQQAITNSEQKSKQAYDLLHKDPGTSTQ